jgi:hypothetical protein
LNAIAGREKLQVEVVAAMREFRLMNVELLSITLARGRWDVVDDRDDSFS